MTEHNAPVEYTVEATWVLYGGTQYETRHIVEARARDEADARAEVERIRRDYSTPDEARSDRQYVESVVWRVDPIVEDNPPPVDEVIDAIVGGAVLEAEARAEAERRGFLTGDINQTDAWFERGR